MNAARVYGISARWMVLVVAALAGAFGPQLVQAQDATPLPTVQLPPELDRVLRDYETAWRARDAAALAALFHAEGFVLSPGSPAKRGREAIQNHYRNAGGPLTLRAVGFGAQDTIAYIVGAFRGAGEEERGKFLLALRRANARQPWLIAADMDNTNSR